MDNILDYILIFVIIAIIIAFYTVNYQFLIFLSVISFCSIVVFKYAPYFDDQQQLSPFIKFLTIVSFTGIIGFPFLTAYRMAQTTDSNIAGTATGAAVGILLAIITISLTAIIMKDNDNYFFQIFSNTIGNLAVKLTESNNEDTIKLNIGKLMWIILTGVYATSATNTFITIHTKPIAK